MDFSKYREINLKETKKQMKESLTRDLLIIQAVRASEDIDKTISMLSKRLRDWYDLYNPEFRPDSIEAFVHGVAEKKAHRIKETIGSEMNQEDVEAICSLAKNLVQLFKARDSAKKYTEKLMSELCPNIQAVAGTQVGSKLLSLSGSLKSLAISPASKVQVLGAEKALFRHLKNKKNLPPKHGVLHEHEFVQKSKEPGKVARMLADKIVIAAKMDYFKGEFIGNKLRREIEARL